MSFTRPITAAVAALCIASMSSPAHSRRPSRRRQTPMHMTSKAVTAADLRVTLDNLFGEHAVSR